MAVNREETSDSTLSGVFDLLRQIRTYSRQHPFLSTRPTLFRTDRHDLCISVASHTARAFDSGRTDGSCLSLTRVPSCASCPSCNAVGTCTATVNGGRCTRSLEPSGRPCTPTVNGARATTRMLRAIPRAGTPTVSVADRDIHRPEIPANQSCFVHFVGFVSFVQRRRPVHRDSEGRAT
jgi:hypothetical protein